MNSDLLGFILICLIVILSYRIYRDSDLFHLKCIISNVDGNTYCVRDRTKLKQAVHLLAQVTTNMKNMVAYMERTHPNDERTQRLVNGFNPDAITETLPTSTLTAYSENKGEKIALCLNKNKKRGEDDLIDINTLTFVALHELSHIMTKSIGHKQEFWENFKFLLDFFKRSEFSTDLIDFIFVSGVFFEETIDFIMSFKK